MIDNFETIRNILDFSIKDTMYFVMILQRRKDIPELSKPCKKTRSYYIRSLEDFDKCKPSIIDECNLKKARAYINITPKSSQKVALLALKKISDQIYSEQYDTIHKVYDSACATCTPINKNTKYWMIDVDDKNTETIDNIMTQLNELKATNIHMIPTKNGFHIITNPFNVSLFKNIVNVEIKKQSDILLYYSG
jgi:hypothetical protein